ncbi:protein cup-like [Glossina fuscipes fuscipes]
MMKKTAAIPLPPPTRMTYLREMAVWVHSSTDGTEREEKSSLKERYHIVTKNYVKPAMSGFLVVSSLKDEQQSKDQVEEPEWFSCGPTSCLGTIDLCGFG